MEASTLLRTARHRSGLSQRDVARLAGVPQSTVARVETGAIDPRVDTLARLLRASGHDLELVGLLGMGIDRGQLRERLARTPRQRLEDLTAASAAIRRIHGRARADRR